MSELNIDGSLVQAHVRQQDEKLVEMSNGCICCTLREDLLKEVAVLAKENKFDHLIIESTGISEPLPVAETFTFETEKGQGESLLDLANIDSMVTVVGNIIIIIVNIISFIIINDNIDFIDAVNFLKDMQQADDLIARGIQADGNDTRTITDLLVSQVEFASVILINKCDLATPENLVKVRQMIRALNSNAKIIESVRSKIDINEVIGSQSYDFDQVAQSPAWIKAINDNSEKVPETEEYGISSFLYTSRIPFHAERLMEFVNTKLAVDDDEDDDVVKSTDNTSPSSSTRILRSKGFFWLASRPTEMMVWSQAGGLFQLSPGGAWWIDTPKDLWPEDEESKQQIQNDWDEKQGDRRQELVFIGTDMNKNEMITHLNKCLLTPTEMALGPDEWIKFDDPFAELQLDDDDDYDNDDESVEMISSTKK